MISQRRQHIIPSLIVIILSMLLFLSIIVAQEPVPVTIFVDEHALVVHVPESGQVSLQDFGFQVEINGQTRQYFLDDYTSFALPLNTLTTPICFRLLESGETTALPLECDPARTLTQNLNVANVFWYDRIAANFRTLLVTQGDSFIIDFCAAGNTSCGMNYIPPTFTPTPDPIEAALQAWANSPQTNDDWTPIEREFNGVPMMLVPPGCFMMGSEDSGGDEQPIHEQCIEEALWIDKTEVTNAQYGSEDWCFGNLSSSKPLQPRNCVTWFEARDYCSEYGARLPTEAEWEYAARGTDNLLYPWGNEQGIENVHYGVSIPNYPGTFSVGSFTAGASWVGALDMIGNVYELTNSLFESYPYEDNIHESSMEDDMAVQRVMRGGALNNIKVWHTTERVRIPPNVYNVNVGFRCIRNYE